MIDQQGQSTRTQPAAEPLQRCAPEAFVGVGLVQRKNLLRRQQRVHPGPLLFE